ncbi:hypothetical protein LI99_11060 [Mycolicibacterium smegmatis]|uniref:Uncharacterized protein n=2 Tax=Mycolicibacterium smegmatis (strain ATCC 700084 / mc(2)155) TaxID=246196 RepID=I7G7K1_MYCS2|nr:hypothetical protein MSMEG_2222 [Mycolicibacterium smegmatis MC2 155]AIU14042.1 hypothetical protein LI99_11060 [Mycolicibacterium smegmatis]AFP38639.1 hypothetical protein MSMEI_2169 [Mycolicibacterium smegmatis MC2 155]AIU07417.1 hypothetical protein LJ00_11060 [Mycolicibacterium smegmatis MC2 155]AIU20665.1 hypothetical protein LI98_11065 [Mycolicibacterium smegmatis]
MRRTWRPGRRGHALSAGRDRPAEARFDDAAQYVPNAPAVGIDKSLKRG